MKYKLSIYHFYDTSTPIETVEFDYPSEIESVVNEYEGYPAKLEHTDLRKTLIEGALDESFLDDYYYE